MTIYDLDQRTGELYAVSALLGECESLCASGDLNECQEESLRLMVARTAAAFRMPSKAERAFQPLPDEFQDDRFEKLVASERNTAAAIEPLLRLLSNPSEPRK